MGIFRELGRQVEQFKQAANDAVEEQAAAECQACGERFTTPADECPECGSTDIASVSADA